MISKQYSIFYGRVKIGSKMFESVGVVDVKH